MTDNDIIKALEYCSDALSNCTICPYEDDDNYQCFDKVKKDAIDLINRQKAEIEKRDRAFEELIKVARLWKEKYNNAKTEIERLNNQLLLAYQKIGEMVGDNDAKT